jgi:hypothetical protein
MMEETMRVLTLTELMRLTRSELLGLATRMTTALASLPEGLADGDSNISEISSCRTMNQAEFVINPVTPQPCSGRSMLDWLCSFQESTFFPEKHPGRATYIFPGEGARSSFLTNTLICNVI